MAATINRCQPELLATRVCAQSETPQILVAAVGSLGGRHSYEDQRETHSNSLRGTWTSKEFEGIRPGKLLGFVLRANRQSGIQTSVVVSHSIRAEAALEPYSQSQTTVGELHSGRASAAPGHPNFGCGASSPLGYGCKRNNLGWTGFYLNSCCIRCEPFCL